MKTISQVIGREQNLFATDMASHAEALQHCIAGARFLVLGGAGSIGQAVTKEIFKRRPRALDVIDISENNLVELVRDIRSSHAYDDSDFRNFALDIASPEYDAFIQSDGRYDYVLNLSALKHVRSEKDPYTLMRMVDVNILNTLKTARHAQATGSKKFFCVSTDKAANPVNMMGASKRIMELFLMRESEQLAISTARFANVAFSDGSLLYGFHQRLNKQQPIVAPVDIKRYFVTPQESGELCLLSAIFGHNRDIFFPKLNEAHDLLSFADIAVRFLQLHGYEPWLCESEEEARLLAKTLPAKGKWPCLFTPSDTTGEKAIETFFTENEILDMRRFAQIGVIKNALAYDNAQLDRFIAAIAQLRHRRQWNKDDLVHLFFMMLPDFAHQETGKYLDGKM